MNRPLVAVRHGARRALVMRNQELPARGRAKLLERRARDWARFFGGGWLPPRTRAHQTPNSFPRGGVPGILTGRVPAEGHEFIGSAF
jgi:hypothetical protein